MGKRKYLDETKNWNVSKWKKHMNINKVHVGDIVEGIWFPDGYFSGKIEMICRKKGFLTKDGSVALLSDAHSFRVKK